LPEGHGKIAAAKIRLGSSLAGLGRFEEAEDLILTGFSTIQETAPGSLIARRSWRWVIRLYESWGKPDEAARYREWSDAELGK